MATTALQNSVHPFRSQARARVHELALVARTRPSVPLLAAFFVPGLGSMINGDVRRGGLILAGFVVSALLSVVILGILGMFAFWLMGLIDAYDGATNWDEHVRRRR